MKGKHYLLVGLVAGLALGWTLGFLRLPYLEKNHSFLLGFAVALVCFAVVLLLMQAWNGYRLSGRVRPKPGFSMVLLGIFVAGVLVVGGAMYRQNAAYQRENQLQDKKMQDMAAWVTTVTQNDHKPLLTSVLNDVSAALKDHPGRKLEDTLLSRITALGFACKPHPYFEADTLTVKSYSPERGQLLLSLALMPLDTASFAQILRKTTFAGADLRGADLKGRDLKGINLRGALLKDADLSGADLSGADLREANLWGANLNRANLGKADVRRADLTWAQLNGATLDSANLNGAILNQAQLRKSVLHGATFQWAQLGGALFNEAVLTNVDFTGADFAKTNLSQANLEGADLRRATLTGTDLVGATLNKTLVDEDWPAKVKAWQPANATTLLENYTVVNDTADAKKQPLFRLKKR